jgi:hypothetical protein
MSWTSGGGHAGGGGGDESGDGDAKESKEKKGDAKEAKEARLIAVSLADSSGGDGSASAVRSRDVQRVWELIGFELETDIRILEGGAALAYGEEIFTAAGWCIKVDGVTDAGDYGVLEFVITAQLSWDTIGPVVDAIVAVATRAQTMFATSPHFTFTELLTACGLGAARSRGTCRLTVSENRDVHPSLGCFGAPQCTVGVPLARLAEVLSSARMLRLVEFDQQRARTEAERLAAREPTRPSPQQIEEAARKLVASQPGNYLVAPQSELLERAEVVDGVDLALDWGRRMRARLPSGVRLADLDKAVGLMALVMRYLNEGFYRMQPARYAKSIFAVMARTHFAAMFACLGTAQGLFATEIVIMATAWAEGPLGDRRVLRAGFTDAGLVALCPGRRPLRADERLPMGGGLVATGGTVAFHGPTIRDWINSILAPTGGGDIDGARDLDRRLATLYSAQSSMTTLLGSLSRRDLMSRGALAFNSVSMGLFDIKMIEGVPFVVVEIREWPKFSLAPTRWKPLLGRLWTFFHQNCWAMVERASVDLSAVRELGVSVVFDEALLGRLREKGGSSATPGDCLFNAVLASGLFPTETAASLRVRAANELRNHWERYIDQLPNDVEAGDDMARIIENAANYIATPGNWRAGVADLAPIALANALGHPIQIRTPAGVRRVGAGRLADVFVVYNGIDHYTPDPSY